MSEEINWWTQQVIDALVTDLFDVWRDEAHRISEDIPNLKGSTTAEVALAAELEASFYEDVDWHYIARYILGQLEASDEH